ncbi:hypothetical protein SVAN01_11070 [Stagonosporopsis vannaccii]|nr:hypothetical protein SVAN01_11070 [Stagonosporopsis vannaccii]
MVTPPAVVPDQPFKPLEFWRIATHDRKTLVERIIPYMAAHLPRKYLIQTIAEGYGWSCGIFSFGTAQAGGDGMRCWQQVVTEFWENPSQTIERLLLLAQACFYTLLRYTYRIRFSAHGKKCGGDLILGHIQSRTAYQHMTGMTKREVHRLTGIPNKYGATFYRSCYKDVQRCSGWNSFCASILWFCRSIQFPINSDSPEQILKDLGVNLPSIILQRKWSLTAARLVENSRLAMATADHVKRIDAKVTSKISASQERIEQMEQELLTLGAQCQSLSLACGTMAKSKQCVSLLSEELQTHQRTWAEQLESLRNNIYKTEANCQRSIAALTGRMRRDGEDSGVAHAPKHASSTLEDLVVCRWLLENLPTTTDAKKGFGNKWRKFWEIEWVKCENSLAYCDHPLRTLKSDEKYDRIGKHLYSTLSNILHGYGRLRNVPLHPDVQILVNTIRPVHYNKDKEIDIEAERTRWLIGRHKVASRREVL